MVDIGYEPKGQNGLPGRVGSSYTIY